MPKLRYADSLVLALVSCGLLVVGGACGYTGQCELLALLWLAVTGPLTILAAGFAVRDLRRPALRWQAVLALALCCLVFVLTSMALVH